MSKVEPNGYNEEVRAILDEARSRAGLSKDGAMKALSGYGISHGTLRAIYYDQRLGTQEFAADLVKAVDALLAGSTREEAAKAQAIHLSEELEKAQRDRRVLRRAVALMCGVCMDGEPTCWDGSCPLRPVSPLPYARAGATSAPTILGRVAHND